jgi:hypothetical protein
LASRAADNRPYVAHALAVLPTDSVGATEQESQAVSWPCGPSKNIVGYMKEVEARHPKFEHIMIARALGTPRVHTREQLTRFAREVMRASSR